LEGKGMPVLNTASNKGNMFIEFSIAYPKIKKSSDKPGDKPGDKIEELRALLTEVFYGDS
jgi:DnaJ-class molecular chaperone